MYSIAELELFVRTAETANLSKAARELDLQPAAASASLKRLEQRLASRLFERSTRSMRLTQQGEVFLEYCKSALLSLQAGEAALRSTHDHVHGLLRLSAPSDFGRSQLLPWLNEFQDRHPEVRLVVHFSDQVMNLYREPIDIAFRYGKLDDSALISQQLAANHRVVVAAPSYLKKFGIPKKPQDLADHNCLLYYVKHGLLNHWRFYSGRQSIEVKVRGNRMADDGGTVREWAIAGYGVAYKSLLDVQADLQAGRLVNLLNEFTGEESPLHAIYPSRASMTPAAKALIEFLREKLAPEKPASRKKAERNAR
jgi:DNA-binding transcriptional LysR family regulator